MQFTTIAAAAFLAASAAAYEVLTPTLNSTVSKGEKLTVEWTSVDTDAEIFSIYITNFATNHWPPTVVSLAQNVPRDDGSIDLYIPYSLSSDYGWQINFINGTNTYVIYAQSPVFELTGEGVDPTTSSAFPTATGYTNTTTATVPGATVTATATLIKEVSTVIFKTPIVWFVEPSKEAAVKTVTHYANGPAPTECATSGPKPTQGPGGHETKTPGGVAKPSTLYHIPPTGTGAPYPTFTGAASSVQVSGAMALVVGAIAFML